MVLRGHCALHIEQCAIYTPHGEHVDGPLKDPSEGPRLLHSSAMIAPNTANPSPKIFPPSLQSLERQPPPPPRTPPPKPLLARFTRSKNHCGKHHFGPLFDPQVTFANPTLVCEHGGLVPLALKYPHSLPRNPSLLASLARETSPPSLPPTSP